MPSETPELRCGYCGEAHRGFHRASTDEVCPYRYVDTYTRLRAWNRAIDRVRDDLERERRRTG